MKLVLTGLSHRSAPVEVRERLAIPSAELPGALDRLRNGGRVREALILSTCNRVEVSLLAEEPPAAEDSVAALFPGLVSREELARHFYRLEGTEAVRHLFRVAASLDSMVLGEPQILGQLKEAYSTAKAAGALGGHLEQILSRAFAVAKRVRTETGIGTGAVSVSFAAVELAREIFGSLADRTVMIVGAGKMSELAARHLRRAGAAKILVTNRTRARAEELAKVFDGAVVEFESFRRRLPEVDIVISSSGSPGYLLTKPEMQSVMHARRNRPVFLIDIAVPRNIEPAVNELDSVFLYDIDDLDQVVAANSEERQREAARAEQIVEEEVARLFEGLRAREAGPTIAELQQRLERIRAGELQRMRARLGPLTPQQEEALEQLTRGMMNKVAHGPIAELRRSATETSGTGLVVEVVRRMFALGK